MANNNTLNVTTGKPKVGGAIFVAPHGTALPTDATTTLNVAFENVGFISEDGVVNANTFNSEDIKDWGGSNVMSIEDDFNDKFRFTMMETLNTTVMKIVYGDANVSGASLAAGVTVSAKAGAKADRSWVIEMVQRDNVLKRIVIPDAKLTELQEIAYTNDDATGYSVTLTAYPDGSGATHYEYIKKQSA